MQHGYAAMPTPNNDIPLAYLRTNFELDPDIASGVRRRFRADMSPQWNAQWAGKPAGTRDSKGYFRIQLTFAGRNRMLQAHRVIFALAHGRWPAEELDHALGVKAGNGIGNLREATHAQNNHNRTISPRNTSGYPGVSWLKQRRKWQAQITANCRRIHLGSGFNTREEAGAAYLAAKALLHPFAPIPRGSTTPPNLQPVDRLKMAFRIVKTARRYPDMKLTAWDYLIPA
jgi:hypothetical protein